MTEQKIRTEKRTRNEYLKNYAIIGEHLDIVNNQPTEAVGTQVTVNRSCTITNLRHQTTTLELAAHAVVDTARLSPVRLIKNTE